MEIDDSLRSATRPYIRGRAWRASGKGRRGRRPLRWDRTVFACFQSSRRDTIMRQGAIHAEGNSWQSQFMPVRAIHCPSAEVPPPGRVPFEHLKQSTFPGWQSLRQKSVAKSRFLTPPFAQGRHETVRTRRSVVGTAVGGIHDTRNRATPGGVARCLFCQSIWLCFNGYVACALN